MYIYIQTKGRKTTWDTIARERERRDIGEALVDAFGKTYTGNVLPTNSE